MTTTEPTQHMTQLRGESPGRTTRPGGSARSTALVTAVVLAAAGAAWLVLATLPVGRAAHGSGAHGGGAHGAAAHAGHAAEPGAGLWFAGWALMVVAMMLPPALPLLRTIRQVATRRTRPGTLVTACLLAFVGVWTGVGVLYLGADRLAAAYVDRLAILHAHPQVPAGLAVVATDAYQLTPWKRACLSACRTPRSVVLTVWTGARPPVVEGAAVGALYGAICVGCCWALMLLTLAVGVAALPVMLVAAVVMSAERLLPHVRPLVPAVAVGSIALGLLVLAGIVPAALGTSH
ncbi:DUF2182 domain-containing protein [Luteipulveratus halotolerans]|nr:DUF2182 domain-containing protein [Luteipulveratus halotolerans]